MLDWIFYCAGGLPFLAAAFGLFKLATRLNDFLINGR